MTACKHGRESPDWCPKCLADDMYRQASIVDPTPEHIQFDDPCQHGWERSECTHCTPSARTVPSGLYGHDYPDPLAITNGHNDHATIDDAFPIIDWHELWEREDEDLEWIAEPLLPARRLIAMYSPPKVGKSLLMLEVAAAVATGRMVLGTKTQQRRVLYVDFENDPVQDTRTRLQDMSYEPDEITGWLFMLSFPTLAALDSAQGAQELLAVAERHQVEAIIVDTVSRAVKGEENDNDTWLAFYRHTGLRLKQAGIALMRLDHAGKDITKGQRGGSAKVGDVDAVWRMDCLSSLGGETTLTLTCEAQRFPFNETELTLKRRTEPLRHDVEANPGRAAWEAKVDKCLRDLEAHKVPRRYGRDKARKMLKDAGVKIDNTVLSAALKVYNVVLSGGQNDPG